MALICGMLLFSVIAQGAESAVERPLSPPVNIEFSIDSTPKLGEEVTLRLTITPLEDMHAEISCLLPEGVEVIREKGIMVRPYRERFHTAQKLPMYRQAVVLSVGPLKGGITKEFVFRAKVSKVGQYELIAQLKALAKWGVKEEFLVLNIE